jgi:aryl-alcohol dehydrogenase-like predicted oxidoreductase
VSEKILGKAIKQHNLPRDEIVVMTKVCQQLSAGFMLSTSIEQVYFTVCSTQGEMYHPVEGAEAHGYVNQFGLSRKVVQVSPLQVCQYLTQLP